MYSEFQLKERLVQFAGRCQPPADGRSNLLVAAARGYPLERRWGRHFLAFCQALIEAEQAPPGNLRGLAVHHTQFGGARTF